MEETGPMGPQQDEPASPPVPASIDSADAELAPGPEAAAPAPAGGESDPAEAALEVTLSSSSSSSASSASTSMETAAGADAPTGEAVLEPADGPVTPASSEPPEPEPEPEEGMLQLLFQPEPEPEVAQGEVEEWDAGPTGEQPAPSPVTAAADEADLPQEHGPEPESPQPTEEAGAADPEEAGEGDSDGGESVAAEAHHAPLHAADDEGEEQEEAGDGGDGQVFTSIDLSASSGPASAVASLQEEGEGEPSQERGLQEPEEEAASVSGHEEEGEPQAQEPEPEAASHEQAPPAPDPDGGGEQPDTAAAPDVAIVAEEGQQPAVAAPEAPTTVEAVLSQDGQQEGQQVEEQEGTVQGQETSASAPAAAATSPSLPRPRPAPLRLAIPAASAPPSPAPHAAATAAAQVPPSNWPLFHSPRGGLLPVSPSAATSAPPTGAGHAALETQPSQDDGYEDEQLGDDFMNSPWLPPSHERAKRYREANLFHEGRAPLPPLLAWLCGTSKGGPPQTPSPTTAQTGDAGAGAAAVAAATGGQQDARDLEADGEVEQEQEQAQADLGELGVGVTLHFALLRLLILGFALLLLLNSPAILFYYGGSRLSQDKADLLGSYVFTLGNMGSSDLEWNGAEEPELHMLGLSLSRRDALAFISSMEVTFFILFVALVCYAGTYITRATRRLKRRVLTTKDFAVFVTNLPKHVSKVELIDHFSDLYPLDRPDWKGRPPPPFSGRPKAPVRDLAHVGGDRRYEGKWVAEVVIARRNGQILREALKHKDTALQIRKLRALMKRYGPETAPEGGADPALFQKYKQQLAELEGRMRDVAQQLERDPGVSRAEEESVGAFVVFEYPESARRCLEDYNSMNLFHLGWCFPAKLLFNGRHRLKVQPAPAPDDVMWENLELSEWARRGRSLAAHFATLFALALSFIITVLATKHKTELAAQLPDLGLCAREIPALYMGGDYGRVNASLQLNAATLKTNPGLASTCASLFQGPAGADASFWAVYSYHGQHMLPAASYDLGACAFDPCPNPSALTHCPCLFSDPRSYPGSWVCRTLPCFAQQDGRGRGCEEFPYSWIAGCFCLGRVQNLMAERRSVLSLIKGWDDEGLPFCKSFSQALTTGAILQALLSIATLFISICLLPPVVKWLTTLERHRSADQEASQLLMRLFLAQFFNVAVLLLIVYGGHPSIQRKGGSDAVWARVLRWLGVFAGDFRDTNPDWFAVVGTQLYLNALVCALSPHLWPFLEYMVVKPALRFYAWFSEAWYGTPPYAMQRDLNAIYVGPTFDMTTRAAQLLSMTFLALLFSTGLPLMLALAALAFFLFYVADYFLLLRFYQRPPQRDERLHRRICQCLPYALCLHLAMAVWMLGNPDVLGAADSSSSNPTPVAGPSALEVGIKRILQPHTCVLFVLWFFTAAYIVAVDVLPSRWVATCVARIHAVITATCCSTDTGADAGRGRGRRRRRVSSEPTSLLDVREDNGFSKVFERPLPPERLAPGPGAPRVEAGWQEVYNEQGVPVLRKLRDKSPRVSSLISSPYSPRSPAASPGGLAYRRTWEVLKANGLWSYELHRSPRYRDAVLAFAREFCPPATSKVGKSLRGSYWAGQGQWRPTTVVPRIDEETAAAAEAAEAAAAAVAVGRGPEAGQAQGQEQGQQAQKEEEAAEAAVEAAEAAEARDEEEGRVAVVEMAEGAAAQTE